MFALSARLWATGDYSLAHGIHDAPAVAVGIRRCRGFRSLGISLHLGIDGLSLALVVLTGFLGILSVLCSWSEIQRRTGFFHLNLLWIIGGVIGVFLALDLFLFFLFWEMMLVPMYFLIALWGHRAASSKSRISAATKFFIYTQASRPDDAAGDPRAGLRALRRHRRPQLRLRGAARHGALRHARSSC